MRFFFLSVCTLIFSSSLLAQNNFQDVSFQQGVVHSYLGEITGGGVSFYDFDRDGLDDITLSTGTGELLHFYKNTGAGFQKLPPLVGHILNAKQILWVDFDNDLDSDLFVATYDGSNRLYENTGDLALVDITEQAGIPINNNRTYGAAFGDYNRDGWLDLYYSERINGMPNANRFYLLENNADGTFSDVTEATNTMDLGKIPFCAAFLDYDNDKWPDIYIANDKSRGNVLLQNQGNGTFNDVSEATGTVLSIEAMSIAVGDYNNDGLSDIYCTNIPADGSVLLQNNSTDQVGAFSDVAANQEVGFFGFGWGSNFLDADNDGDLDLYVSGNLVNAEAPCSAFYTNMGNRFEESIFDGDDRASYNNAIGDFNNDGFPDIIELNQVPYNTQLWQNNNTNQNWLKVQLQGVWSNRDAVGSKIEIYAADTYQMRYTHCGIGFLGQNSATENIGLAQNNMVDSLIVTWPTGHIDRFYEITPNQKLTLIEGSSTNDVIDVDQDVTLLINEPPTPALATHFVPSQDTAQIDHVVRHSSFMGGGSAFFDYDNDGDDDLYITSGLDMDHFYENQGDGTFINKNMEAGFDATFGNYTMGVIAGDIDNDGFKDLFITTNRNTEDEPGRNFLYKNNGDGTFTDIWGVNFGTEKSFSIGATFTDYDLDGLLDIYVITYVDQAGFLYDDDDNINGFDHDCYKNLFYHNLGNGQFEEIAGDLGLDDTGCALAVASTDFDFDGDLDLYIANDFGAFIQPNKLYENENGVYNNVAEELNINTAMYGMGIAVGDIDKDLDLDYYVTNFGKNALIRNDNSSFSNITDASGTGNEWVHQDSTMAVSWGTAFVDIDNDTDLDLFVSNGYVPSPSFLPSTIFMNDKLFLNNGDLTFTDTNEDYGISNKYTSRGMAYSDYDNDGDVDLLSVVLNVPINGEGWQTILNRNEKGNEKNWFQVSLEGVDVNRDAYGSRVLVHVGDEVLLRELSGGASHCSHSSSRLHFGMNDYTTIDSLQVIWTGGQRSQTIYDLDVNQHINILEDTTIAMLNTIFEIEAADTYFEIFPNPATDQLTIQTKNNASISLDQIQLFNTLGQAIQDYEVPPNVSNITLNIHDLSSGIYYLLLRGKEQNYIEKIVLE